jgi:hypothetical protein
MPDSGRSMPKRRPSVAKAFAISEIQTVDTARLLGRRARPDPITPNGDDVHIRPVRAERTPGDNDHGHWTRSGSGVAHNSIQLGQSAAPNR